MAYPKKHPISFVERETGITKETLRIWESRYSFPNPQRDGDDNRLYSSHDIEQLKLIKKLLDHKFRPNKIVGLSLKALQDLLHGHIVDSEFKMSSEMTLLISAIKEKSQIKLNSVFENKLAELGLRTFLSTYCSQILSDVGQAWSHDHLGIEDEHFFSEVLQAFFYKINFELKQIDPLKGAVLLTTPPGEIHSLGLQMAKLYFQSLNISVIPLGTQTPVTNLIEVTKIKKIDFVGISLSGALSPQICRDYVHTLRRELEPKICMIIGGEGAKHINRNLPNTYIIRSLSDLDLITQNKLSD